MRTPRVALVAAALWGACAADPELEPATETPVRIAAAKPPSCKPEPPVAIAMTSRPLAGDRFELTVTATPSAMVDALDVAFVLPAGAVLDRPERESFGATTNGQQRVVRAIVEPRARTMEISAIVKVPVDGIAMTKATTVTIGEPKPVPRTKVYATPDGELAREVRR